MTKTLSLLVGLLCLAMISYSQADGIIRGKLLDTAAKQPLTEATVSVVSSKDSSLVSYTLSNKQGVFEIKDLEPGDYRLLISFKGYQPVSKNFTLTAERKTIDLGNVIMEKDYKVLSEVIVTDQAPIKISQDTVEFRADAFKTKPNATVEDLLKKVPGMQVEKDGTVKAMGEQVQKVYVDGKEFFGTDPKLATKNLTADMVESVQVFDDMSDQAKFTKMDDGSKQKALNIKLKKDKKKGFFGRGLVGAGTEGRYESNVSFNHFDGDKQLSLLANANNINKQGFSFNDIVTAMGGFQNMGGSGGMGGGGGMQIMSMRGGGIPGMFGGSSGGLSRSISTGVNYNNYITPKLKLGANYFFSDTRTETPKDVFRKTSNGDTTTDYSANSYSNNRNQNHRLNMRLEYKIDSMNSILYTPSFTIQHSEGMNNDTSFSYLSTASKKYLSVTSRTNNSNERDGINLNNNFLFQHRFSKIGRTITLGWSNTYGKSEGNGFNFSPTTYYNEDGTVWRSFNQDYNNKQTTYTHNNVLSTSYTEPLGKNKLIEVNYAYTHNSSSSDKQTYNFDPGTGKYSVLNIPLTNYFKNLLEINRVGANFRVQQKKYNYQLGGSMQLSTLQSMSRRASIGKDSLTRQNYKNFSPVANFNYQPNRGKSFRFNYRGRTNPPTLSQLQNVPDPSNPLQVKVGNPELKQEFNHNVNIGYNTFNILTFKFFAANLNFSTTANKIVNSTTGTFTQIIRPVNLNGAFTSSAFVTLGLPFKNKKLKGSSVNLTSSTLFNRDVSLVEGNKNIGKTITLTEGAGVNLSLFNQKLDLGINANVSYYNVRYTINQNLNSSYFTQTYSADFGYTFPKSFIVSTDFDLYVNTGRENGFNQAIPMWNASVSKQIFKKKNGEIKLSVNNILDEDLVISRTAVDNYIEDSRTRTLGQYFMLSFMFNLNRMGGKNINPMQGMPMPKMMERNMKNIRIMN